MFSEIIAGTMRWGIWGANHSEKEVQKLIDVCLEENITTFDHADIYGGHTTEELFGNAWKEMDIDRDKVQFISKCGIVMNSGKKPSPLKYYNYDSDYIQSCVDGSLKNLKTDYLDVLLLHRPSPLMNPEEIADTFQILKDQGKVKHFGVSNFSVSQFELINRYFPLVTNQIEVSVNEIAAFDNGILDQLILRNLRPTAWSVMGNYFTEKTIQNIRIKNIIEILCQKYNAQENQVLLAFILKHPARIIPVIGTSQAETIKVLNQSLSINLEIEDWFRILEAIKGKEVD
ncbi:aldo/keto reductase [Epilithonimonas arachidiradicis]|uniref:Oxidoreductase YcsN n=1 Tax=Epilithonimonas arachidiradicis TaxID=1617282 RepID=A0A420CPW3_9FLAO|nr:aldo/keto reductase [Epilithonimonas arachidiradicis]RKE80460.1 putative oxidoreductase [Epilithonimonas arachidiradicis]GGG63599.1 putative oxidoreductase YcsN [Epilithonimonas arachidiradicis]